MPRGLGLVSQPHALMATCPPNQLRPVLSQGVSDLCRAARVKTDGLAEQEASDHPAEQHEMALVADRAVLTQEASELNMEPGGGIHEGLVWCENPKLSWLPAHPMA